jgi:hypothetical protein
MNPRELQAKIDRWQKMLPEEKPNAPKGGAVGIYDPETGDVVTEPAPPAGGRPIYLPTKSTTD